METAQAAFAIPQLDLGKLNVVYAHYQRSEPFSIQLFEGFEHLRVLTYSASIPMTVRMLNLFETVECVFGYEGILSSFGEILAWQKEFAEKLMVAIKALDDNRKNFIIEKVGSGHAKFFVVKDAIAHSKIYLLEKGSRRRVIVGSANLSERAFSGKQAETLIAFDDDELAWSHYQREFEAVKESSSTEFHFPGLSRVEAALEDVPVLQEAKNSRSGLTVYVNTDATTATIPTIVRRVERLAQHYDDVTKPVLKQRAGRIQIDSKIVGTIIHLVRSQRPRDTEVEEPSWLSIDADSHKMFLSGREISLDTVPDQTRSDVGCLTEYFENFQKGFLGNVPQHQKDYFMFMCWFYFSPFVCDLRNSAVVTGDFIFDYPMFAILFGKSNTGKTELIKTLMTSMFGEWKFVDKADFTNSNLRALRASRKRFPLVFDDVERDRFVRHGSDVIKDETFVLPEYPPVVLSMNAAERHSFSTEIMKRCLMLYTSAALPENAPTARELHQSVSSIQKRISTALYREYLRRVLDRLAKQPVPADILQFSSRVLTEIFAEHCNGPLPGWCTVMTINDYRSKKYERIQMDLRKMYESNRDIWQVKKEEVIIRTPQTEYTLQRDIPDWILRPGSRAGNLVLDRRALEDFLEVSFRRRWIPLWGRK